MKRLSLILLLVMLMSMFIIKGCTETQAASEGIKISPTSTPAAQVIRWRVQACNVLIPDPNKVYPYNGTQGIYQRWADWVKAVTNGRLIIEMAIPGAIVPEAGAFDAVSSHSIDGCVGIYPASYSGAIKEADVIMGLPFAWETPQEAYDAFYRRGMLEIVQPVFKARNIYAQMTPLGATQGIISQKRINKSYELKGLKLRAAGIYGDYIKEFGASPTSIPNAEQYQALKLGTIDGTVGGITALWDIKLGEVCKYFVIKPNLNSVVLSNIFNLDAWNALPTDIRETLERDSHYIFAVGADEYNLQWQILKKQAEKSMGITYVSWSDEDISSVRKMAFEKLWPKVAAKSAISAKLVDIVRAQSDILHK
jgi:TRAP-type C4-dicarboxylate transport system substrate-binding protein